MTDTQRGIFLYLIAWTFIPIMDGIAKYLSFNFHVLQIVWARYFFTTIIVLPIILFLYKKNFLSSEKYSLQIVRGTFLVIATLCFFYSISIIPLADALALAFVYPLFITFLSPILLNEKISINKLIAVIIGFFGVLFITKPGFNEFNLAYIAALGTGLAYSFYMISTRKLIKNDTPLKTLFFTGLVGFFSMTFFQPIIWINPTSIEWILMLSLGLVATIGHFLIILSFRYAEASILAPFSYWEILTNILIGFYFFKDIPDKWTWVGIIIIISSGIYVLLQKRI
tara:strand:- start:1935 stop:2783 length:849 start_codon:yes stop_codon:yes gene_type:complete